MTTKVEFSVPPGYRWDRQMWAALMCERCGCLVYHEGVDAHEEFHDGLVISNLRGRT